MPATTSGKKDIEQYRHKVKSRCNNPQVGLVDPDTDPNAGVKTYMYDPHINPHLDWAGKAERHSRGFFL